MSLSLHEHGPARVKSALAGVVPAFIAVPIGLSVWTPAWFAVAWGLTYLASSATWMIRALRGQDRWLEELWSTTTAIIFAAVPISTVIWSGDPEHFWMAAATSVLFIAFEMTALPLARMAEWRVGAVLVAVTTTICGLTVIHPVLALAFTPLVLAMLGAADRMRRLKVELEAHLAAAELALRQDPLTGLLNRRGLRAALDVLDGQEMTIALIDVDRFKMVNDTHGHQVGDHVLKSLAEELDIRFDDRFELARLGGDEFVALAPGRVPLSPMIAAPAHVEATVHDQPLTIESSFSIGISHGRNTESAHRLLSEAGFAMREAKRSGGTIERFGVELAERLDRTLEVASVGNRTGGVATGALFPVAQTIVEGDRIVGCEVLARWMQQDGRVLLPAQFLPMATDVGLMKVINDKMLLEAIRFAARFNNHPDAPFVSVNISAPHLSETLFCTQVESLLEQHRVSPARLLIEITETEELVRFERWAASASRLRALGVKLALDDFGTGYSSLERLQDLPITHLKFDRSLVQSAVGPFSRIVNGVVSFARAANIEIIAEGIETFDEQESMHAFGVTTFQGFRFHRPESLDDVERRVIAARPHQPQERGRLWSGS